LFPFKSIWRLSHETITNGNANLVVIDVLTNSRLPDRADTHAAALMSSGS
jgi:hypothetical protein